MHNHHTSLDSNNNNSVNAIIRDNDLVWARWRYEMILKNETHLCCSKYCAFHIWCEEPEMVMIRSVEPGRGSSMVMLAPESPRILRIRAPPLPIIAPANCNKHKKRSQSEIRISLLFNWSNITHVFRNGNLGSFSMAAIVFTENPFVMVHPEMQT